MVASCEGTSKRKTGSGAREPTESPLEEGVVLYSGDNYVQFQGLQSGIGKRDRPDALIQSDARVTLSRDYLVGASHPLAFHVCLQVNSAFPAARFPPDLGVGMMEIQPTISTTEIQSAALLSVSCLSHLRSFLLLPVPGLGILLTIPFFHFLSLCCSCCSRCGGCNVRV